MASDVNIGVSDLMAAFAAECASLTQRAILAEQRASAYEKAMTATRERLTELEARLAAERDASAEADGLPDAAA